MDEHRGDVREAEILQRLAEAERRLMLEIRERERRKLQLTYLTNMLAFLTGRGRG